MAALLYHYTCSHSVNEIRYDKLLIPHRQPVLADVSLVWLTDLEEPDRIGLGLTSHTLGCDRAAYRVTANAEDAVAWTTWCRNRKIAGAMRRRLETQGTLPAHWWVSESSIRVLAIR